MQLVAMWCVTYCGFHPAPSSPTPLVGHVTGDMKRCESNETRIQSQFLQLVYSQVNHCMVKTATLFFRILIFTINTYLRQIQEVPRSIKCTIFNSSLIFILFHVTLQKCTGYSCILSRSQKKHFLYILDKALKVEYCKLWLLGAPCY